ncbi:MAG: TIR domain-containing protein [Chloroflexota bacterium]|nr:MAG: TIR domain-containing protein [Chloroflexota bacterium]
MGHIFFSYSRADQRTVDELIRQIEAYGYDVWIDRESIIGGDPWKAKIVEAVEAADVFLLALSRNSVLSDNVRTEVDLAQGAKTPILPVILEPHVDIPRNLKYQLAGIHRVDISTGEGIQPLVEALASALEPTVPFRKPTHHPPPKKPLLTKLRPGIGLAIILAGIVIILFAIIVLDMVGLLKLPAFNEEAHLDPTTTVETTSTTGLEAPAAATLPLSTDVPEPIPNVNPEPTDLTNPTDVLEPTPTVRPEPSSPTDTPEPIDTPEPTQIVISGTGFEQDCILADFWIPNPASSLQTDERNCWNLSNWGIEARENGLLISANQPGNEMINGIYSRIAEDVTIDFEIRVDQLWTSYDDVLTNIGFGVLPSNLSSDAGHFVYYQKESPQDGYPVFVKHRERGGYDAYLTLDGDYVRYPLGRVDRIEMSLVDNVLNIYLNDSKVAGPLNVTFQDRVFWIGYRMPEGGTIEAQISELSIQE